MILFCNKSNEDSLTEIKKAIKHSTLGSNALVIKNGLKIYKLNGWVSFLKNQMKFKNDDRQIVSEDNIERTVWWAIRYDKDRESVYTHSKTKQPLHNDNSWFSDPAEMVFLAFEKQALKGGQSTFYFLDRLIYDLEKEEKNLLDDLRHEEVIIRKDITGKYFNRTTIIKNDQIFWNYYRTIKDRPRIKQMCKKFFLFLEKKEKTKSVIKYRCNTNDILCFNDSKVLHGRLGFSALESGDRVLHQSMWYL